ncbi:hypothetical protein SAMN05428976_101186 [Clostridium sp. USBA 49]|jgi:hypothetical protein|uniref:DUF445 family protein n=1 Tax=Clostridium sp. USBA 49 TaxID=1881060 RepID=UPI00099A1DDE|nr:DUF445 family protein [Clostridium sp. USBA 49]SKA73238.1 hypothetical protein SAMN05428976_101186 [Clostridium sp. USBA 49]
MENYNNIKIQLNKFILDMLKSDEFKNNISLYIKEEINNIIYIKKEEIFNNNIYKNIKYNIKINIINLLKSEDFKNEIYNFFDYNLKELEKSDKTLEFIISPGFINGFKVYIYNHKDDIIDSIKNFLTNSDIKNKINKEIFNILNGINPMVSKFVNSNTIQMKLMEGINNYLNNINNVNYIINIINTKIDEVMKKRISEFSLYFPDESKKSLINSITNGIINNLYPEKIADTILNKLEENFKKEVYLLNKNSNNSILNINNTIDVFLKNHYNNFLENNKIKEFIDKFSKDIIDNFLNKPVKDFI